MTTIIIPVGKGRPEDDILTLVEIVKNLFPEHPITVSDALVIETNQPNVAALFKQMAGAQLPTNGSKPSKPKNYNCIEPGCENKVSKPNSRCKPHAMRLVAEKNRKSTQEE